MKRHLIILVSCMIYGLTVCAQTSNFDKQVDSFGKGFGASYAEFVKSVYKDYNSFRDSVNSIYADFLAQAWGEMKVMPGTPKPKDNLLPPIHYDKKKDKGDFREIPVITVPFDTIIKPQPKPAVPIRENDQAKEYSNFTMFGTQMKVRWADLKDLKLKNTDEKGISTVFRMLTSNKYNNLIRDCLANRIQYKLSDWAYYKMLQALANEACGKGTDEATVVLGILLNQSGYSIRFGYEPDSHHPQIFIKTTSSLYDRSVVVIGNDVFYSPEPLKSRLIKVCNASYPGEKPFSLEMCTLPVLSYNASESRTIESAFYSVTTNSTVNKNLIDFFNTYPASYSDNNFMTKWAFYANTPVSEDVKNTLYPQLRKAIGNADEKLAANILLNWVQTGFSYEYDDKIWGHDRAFFAEETLYYPYSDCEDRSILYSHLVRDLLGLDVVLVYYPNHLATAVCFNEEVTGDFITLDGRKFTIADGTYIGAGVGRTQPNADNSKAKVILLKKKL